MPDDSLRSAGSRDDFWADLVRELSATARRQLFPAVVSVGGRAGQDGRCAGYLIRTLESLDAALRVEVVAALLLRVRAPEHPPPLVWLTRPGTATPHDLDAAWLAASRAAYAEAGLGLTMAVITPHGWVELTRPS